MSDTYQAVYDAVRSRISNPGDALERAAREAIDTAMYDIREYNVRKDSHELTHNQAVDLILSALQANEVKRLSNPVDDGAVERGAKELLAHAEFSSLGQERNLHLAKIAFKAALEAAEPHP